VKSLCLGAMVKEATRSNSSSGSSGSKSGSQQDMQLGYSKMNSVAEEKGLAIVDVPVDGDCALHAVIRQLQQLGIELSYDVSMLRQLAVSYLESHTELVNLAILRACYGGDMKAYLEQQSMPGTLCDENMLHAVADVLETIICVFDDSGATSMFEPPVTCRGKVITIGRIADTHYVSLEARADLSNRDPHKPDAGASATLDHRFKSSERDQGPKDNQEAVLLYSYSKLQAEAEKRRLSVVDVPQTGDSALHAVVRQLHLQDIRLYDVIALRKRAVDYLYSHPYLINKDFARSQSYLSAQSAPGTHCDEIMLSAVSEVIMKEVHILQDDGLLKKLGKQTSLTKPVNIGLYAKVHYVSLEPSDVKQKRKTVNDLDTESKQNNGHFVGQDTSSHFQNAVAIQRASPPAADAGNDKLPAAADDTCAICMDVITDPKTLACKHVFCSQCIDQSLAYQPKCPCCGKLFGVLKGDQPEGGNMSVRRDNWLHLEGYRGCGRIVIDYYIPTGRQKVWYSI